MPSVIKTNSGPIDITSMDEKQKSALFLDFMQGISFKDWQNLRDYVDFYFCERLALISMSTEDLIEELEIRRLKEYMKRKGD